MCVNSQLLEYFVYVETIYTDIGYGQQGITLDSTLLIKFGMTVEFVFE